MMFKKIRNAIAALKRGHPDVYDLLRKYCDERGLNMSDVVASACLTWIGSDESVKKEDLEKALERRRTGGAADLKAAIELFNSMCNSMATMFEAMNKVRSNLSMSAMLSDFKAVTETINEMKKSASEAGKGSIEDLLLTAFLSRLVGGLPKSEGKKLGSGDVKEVSE